MPTNSTFKRVRDKVTGQKGLVRVDHIDPKRHEDLGEPELDAIGREIKSSGGKKSSASGGEPATKPNEEGSK
jgi:hypothetical protein